jgi:nitroreductase
MEAVMDLFEAIGERYSYRGEYKNVPVPQEHLRQIVEAGMAAPSGMNQEMAEFVIVTDPERLMTLATLMGRKQLETAQALIMVVANTEPKYQDMKFWVEDCAAATENMLLAITALGYASCWIDGALRREGRAEKIAQLYSIPKTHSVRIILPVGIPTEPGPRKDKKKPFEERAWFNKYAKAQ